MVGSRPRIREYSRKFTAAEDYCFLFGWRRYASPFLDDVDRWPSCLSGFHWNCKVKFESLIMHSSYKPLAMYLYLQYKFEWNPWKFKNTTWLARHSRAIHKRQIGVLEYICFGVPCTHPGHQHIFLKIVRCIFWTSF
jgi:hypothetical protein